MTRAMYDSINVAGIPDNGQIVCVYGNGRYKATESEVTARFPADKYVVLKIDVTGANADTCQILDVESGDASPQTAALWVQSYKKLHDGALGTVYVSANSRATLLGYCHAANQLPGRDFHLWVADWDVPEETLTILAAEPGVVAVQVKNTPEYDESTVFDAGWYPSPYVAAPEPPKVPVPEPPKVPAPEPTLLGWVVYIQEGYTANDRDFPARRVTSTDGGKTWH